MLGRGVFSNVGERSTCKGSLGKFIDLLLLALVTV